MATMSRRLQASAGEAASRFYARGPKRYHLQTSITIIRVEAGGSSAPWTHSTAPCSLMAEPAASR